MDMSVSLMKLIPFYKSIFLRWGLVIILYIADCYTHNGQNEDSSLQCIENKYFLSCVSANLKIIATIKRWYE